MLYFYVWTLQAHGVEAFVVDVTGRCRDLKSKRGYGIELARADQRAFAAAYGFSEN